MHLNPATKRNLNGGSGHFTIAHGRMTIAQKQHRARHIHREINSVSSACLRRIHVPAKRLRHNGTARLSAGWRYADAAEERMQGNLHRVPGIKSLKSRNVGGVINGIKPDLLLD